MSYLFAVDTRLFPFRLDPDSPDTCLGVEINQTVCLGACQWACQQSWEVVACRAFCVSLQVIFNVTVTVTEVTEELVTEGEGGYGT